MLDTGMMVQAFCSFYMLLAADTPACMSLDTDLYVSAISLMLLLRVSHIVSIVVFFLCCFPCYFCNDACCCKRWLVSSKGLSSQGLTSLYANWTWIFKPIKKGKTTAANKFLKPNNQVEKKNELSHCSICFLQYERGQAVTFLPCQLNRQTLMVDADTSQPEDINVTPDQTDSELSVLTPKISLDSNPGQFDCSHVFHFECLEQWFKEQTRCPLCNLDYERHTLKMMQMVE